MLDYQTQQMKVLPAISSAYAFLFAGLLLQEMYTEIYACVENGDTSRLAEVR